MARTNKDSAKNRFVMTVGNDVSMSEVPILADRKNISPRPIPATRVVRRAIGTGIVRRRRPRARSATSSVTTR